MSVTIICTKKDGTTITAQANSDSAVTWSLHVTQGDGSGTDHAGTDVVLLNGTHSVTWSSVTSGTSYTVTATNADGRTQSKPVPFGTCT